MEYLPHPKQLERININEAGILYVDGNNYFHLQLFRIKEINGGATLLVTSKVIALVDLRFTYFINLFVSLAALFRD